MIVNNSKCTKTKILKVFFVLLLAIGYGRLSFAQTTGTNWVRTRTPQIPVTDTSKLDTIPIQRQAVSISYSDGLGRPLQGIQMMGSATMKDVVQPYVYDNMGRPSVRYLPYADQGTTMLNAGQFRSNAVTDVLNFYNPASPGAPKIPTDAMPYAQTVYEATPLGRAVELGKIGTVFQPGTGHTIRLNYAVNSATDGINNEGIFFYQVDEAQKSIFVSSFSPGVLTKTIVTDENSHRTAIWKDRQGKIVTKSQLDAPTQYYNVNYAYNDLEQLTDILGTPIAYNGILVNYIFHYDSLGRVVEKKIPDKGWVYTVYNHADQPVLVQDSNMRVKHQWMFAKYDAEGRMVQTGIYINTAVTKRTALQYLCDHSYPVLWETWQPGVGYTDNAFPQQSAIPGSSPLSIYINYYYDDYSFTEAAAKPFETNIYNTSPTMRTMGMMTGISVYVLGTTSQRLATVIYYDNQDRVIQQVADNHLGLVDVINSAYNFAGQLTGSQRITTPIAGNTITVKDRYVYDQLNRLLNTYESFQGGAEIDISQNVYNELGQKVSEPLHSTTYGLLPPNSPPYPSIPATITENAPLTAGKADVARTSITLSQGFSFAATSANTYTANISGSFAQVQEFRYNINGLLTSINNGTLTFDNGVTQSDPNALFGESITYEGTSPLSAAPQYNGNISGMTWRNKIEQTGLPGLTTGGQGYAFTYDGVDRIGGSSYFTQSGSTFVQSPNAALTENGQNGGPTIAYDEAGNLQFLQRKDKNGSPVNNLTYAYGPYDQNQLFETNANQLWSMADAGSQNITGTFTYDGNGNMTSDSWKGITATYNYLDLPDTIKQGNSKLVFTYDAAGNKLYKQLITNGAVVSQRHYVEDLEVTASTSIAFDGKIDNVAMDEGRIVNLGAGIYQYEYFLQDHLFNNRVTFRPNADGTLTLSQVQNYYPFGEDMGDATMNYSAPPQNLYLYSGKEWQPELNLNTYDFGARHYDPVLGRWTATDPLAGESEDMSPYNYVENNPMNMIDPDGMQSNGCIGCGTSFDTNIGGGSIPGWSIFGAGANGVTQFFQAGGAFNITKSTVTTQNWSGLNKVQGINIPAQFLMKGPPPPQGTISAWQPNGWDKWKSSGFLGSFTYGIADDAWVGGTSVFWPFGEVTHLNGEYASPKDKQSGFVFTATLFIPAGKGAQAAKIVVDEVAERGTVKLVQNNLIDRLTPAVYDLETSEGRYIGQSKSFLTRLFEHFRPGGILDQNDLIKDVVNSMPGSTKLEREVYEQYLITNAKRAGAKLLNKVDPMGGRMDLYDKMIDDVIKKFNLPKFLPK